MSLLPLAPVRLSKSSPLLSSPLILFLAFTAALLIYAGRPGPAVAVVALLAGLGLAGRLRPVQRQGAATRPTAALAGR